MVRDSGLEPETPDVSDRCSRPTELIPHGGADGVPPSVSYNYDILEISFLLHKLRLFSFDPHSHTLIANLMRRALISK